MPQQHLHYIGSAHTFEIVSETPTVTVIKTFFINDKINSRDWQVGWEGIKKDAVDLPGTALVFKPNKDHPTFSTQDRYDVGTIYDYEIDEEKREVIVYARVTDPKVRDRIKSGELVNVSPAVIPRDPGHVRPPAGMVDKMERSVPVHLAIVGAGAYGADATISHMCTGDGMECDARLKMMTASTEGCGDSSVCPTKIAGAMQKFPGIEKVQAVAIARSEEIETGCWIFMNGKRVLVPAGAPIQKAVDAAPTRIPA